MSHAQLRELETPELRALVTWLEAESFRDPALESSLRKLRRVLAVRILAGERLAGELSSAADMCTFCHIRPVDSAGGFDTCGVCQRSV